MDLKRFGKGLQPKSRQPKGETPSARPVGADADLSSGKGAEGSHSLRRIGAAGVLATAVGAAGALGAATPAGASPGNGGAEVGSLAVVTDSGAPVQPGIPAHQLDVTLAPRTAAPPVLPLPNDNFVLPQGEVLGRQGPTKPDVPTGVKVAAGLATAAAAAKGAGSLLPPGGGKPPDDNRKESKSEAPAGAKVASLGTDAASSSPRASAGPPVIDAVEIPASAVQAAPAQPALEVIEQAVENSELDQAPSQSDSELDSNSFAEQEEAAQVAAQLAQEAEQAEAARVAARQAQEAQQAELARVAAQEARQVEAARVATQQAQEAQQAELARVAAQQAEEARQVEAARVAAQQAEEAARVAAQQALEAQQREAARIAAEEQARLAQLQAELIQVAETRGFTSLESVEADLAAYGVQPAADWRGNVEALTRTLDSLAAAVERTEVLADYGFSSYGEVEELTAQLGLTPTEGWRSNVEELTATLEALDAELTQQTRMLEGLLGRGSSVASVDSAAQDGSAAVESPVQTPSDVWRNLGTLAEAVEARFQFDAGSLTNSGPWTDSVYRLNQVSQLEAQGFLNAPADGQSRDWDTIQSGIDRVNQLAEVVGAEANDWPNENLRSRLSETLVSRGTSGLAEGETLFQGAERLRVTLGSGANLSPEAQALDTVLGRAVAPVANADGPVVPITIPAPNEDGTPGPLITDPQTRPDDGRPTIVTLPPAGEPEVIGAPSSLPAGPQASASAATAASASQAVSSEGIISAAERSELDGARSVGEAAAMAEMSRAGVVLDANGAPLSFATLVRMATEPWGHEEMAARLRGEHAQGRAMGVFRNGVELHRLELIQDVARAMDGYLRALEQASLSQATRAGGQQRQAETPSSLPVDADAVALLTEQNDIVASQVRIEAALGLRLDGTNPADELVAEVTQAVNSPIVASASASDSAFPRLSAEDWAVIKNEISAYQTGTPSGGSLGWEVSEGAATRPSTQVSPSSNSSSPSTTVVASDVQTLPGPTSAERAHPSSAPSVELSQLDPNGAQTQDSPLFGPRADVLSDGRIIKKLELSTSAHVTQTEFYLLEGSDGHVYPVVFKPRTGELAQIREGIHYGTFADREVWYAALAASLQAYNIPSTAHFTTPDGREGSIQALVLNTETVASHMDRNGYAATARFNPRDVQILQLLTLLSGDTDSHGGNLLISDRPSPDGTFRIFGIDHGLAFPLGDPTADMYRSKLPSLERVYREVRDRLETEPSEIASELSAAGADPRAVEAVIARLLVLREDPDLLMAQGSFPSALLTANMDLDTLAQAHAITLEAFNFSETDYDVALDMLDGHYRASVQRSLNQLNVSDTLDTLLAEGYSDSQIVNALWLLRQLKSNPKFLLQRPDLVQYLVDHNGVDFVPGRGQAGLYGQYFERIDKARRDYMTRLVQGRRERVLPFAQSAPEALPS